MGIVVPPADAPVFFISDAHLGLPLSGCAEREKYLIAFLREFVAEGKILFIVGDLFDFWIEYRTAIRPEYFPVLHELRKLVENGVEIHYLAGNHDFILGSFLEKTIGIHIHPEHYETVLQGKKIHLFHGDGLIKRDVGYRILKKILRNPFNQKLYKMLHPDIGVPLGSWSSGSSRKVTSKFVTENVLEEYRDHARRYLRAGSDIVVFAHTHRPEIRHWNGKTFCNSGEWIRKYTFARLEAGIMTLWQYFPGGLVQEIPGSPLESSLNSGSSES
jgi:UDP-2,3-diacylglucosamine hydrolase